MNRLSFDEGDVTRIRTEVMGAYPANSDPCPGSALKVDDDVMWLDMFPMRVLWGHDDPAYFNGFSPEWFGETNVTVAGEHVTDRAPADPQETPMPIWPQQAQQPQGNKPRHDKKAALKHVLSQLEPEYAKKVRELVKAKRPELLDKDG